MKKVQKYLELRSVRLGALAVLVATFVGLPALGQAINTNAFQKLDAVNYLSSVILAEEYLVPSSEGAGSYTTPNDTYKTPETMTETTPESTTYNTTSSSDPCSSQESCESMMEQGTSTTETSTQTESKHSQSSCSGSNCGTMTEYGFKNYSEDKGFTFNYTSSTSSTESTTPVGSQFTKDQSQINSQIQSTDGSKDWTRYSSSTSRLTDKFTEAASQIASKGGKSSAVTALLSAVAGIDSDVTANLSEMNEYTNSLKTASANLSATSTAAEVASVKTGTQLLQTYTTLSQAMDVRVQAAKQSESLADMYLQISNVKAQYKSGSIPSSVQKKLDAVEAQADKLAAYVTEANEQYTSIASEISTIRGYTDSDEISTALAGTYSLGEEVSSFSEEMEKDFEEFWESNPFATLNEAATGAQTQQLQGSMTSQISEMKEGISSAKTGLALIQSLNIDKSTVTDALSSLTDSADKMTKVMGKMETALTEADGELSSENTDKFLEIQSSIMNSVGTNMQVVTDYLNDNESLWENSPDAAIIKEFIAHDLSGSENAEENYGEAFDEVYSESATSAGVDLESVKDKIEPENMAGITQEISASLMTDLAKYIDDDEAGEALENLINKIPFFGEKGSTALQSTTDVLDASSEIPSDEDAVTTEGTEEYVEALIEAINQVKKTVISDNIGEDLKSAMNTAADYRTTGATSEEIEALTEEINDLLAQNDASLTDEGLQFNDVKLSDDDWYGDAVMQLKEDGIVKGKSEGNYDPSGEVTYAEVAKMAMEASGEGKSSGVPSDSSAVGQWYQAYVKSVEENAPEFAEQAEGQWNEACPREWVAVLIGEAYGLQQSEYEGGFEDVSASDENADWMQTVYDYGVMKGDSTGGTYRPEEGINRAEVATVIYRADESVGETSSIDKTLDTAEDDLDAILEELGVDETSDSSTSSAEDVPTAQKILSVLGNLRAMLPFLNQ